MRRHSWVGGRGWRRTTIACLLVVAFILASSASIAAAILPARSASASTIPSGYHRVNIRQAGLSMVVPDAWTKADLTSHPIDQFLRRLRNSDPKTAKFVAQHRDTLAKNGLFAAVDPQAKIFSDQVTVMAIPSTDGKPSLPTGQAVQITSTYAQSTGLSNVQVADANLDGAPAALAVGVTQLPAGKGRSVAVHGTGYLVATKDGALEIDFLSHKDGRQDKTVQTAIHSVTLDDITVPCETTNTSTQNDTQSQGTATGSPICSGSFTATYGIPSQPPSCGPGPGVPFQTSINLAAANGDTLNESGSGTTCQSGTRTVGDFDLFTFDYSGTYTITTGTGCFADATGSGKISGQVVFNSATSASVTGTGVGTITLKKQPHCPYAPTPR
jgi:hypothetical protein